jgi:hypothetical protein
LPVILLLSRHLLFAIIPFVFVTGVSSAVAWISWMVFERQFLKLKQYFEYRGKPGPKADVRPDASAVKVKREEETAACA